MPDPTSRAGFQAQVIGEANTGLQEALGGAAAFAHGHIDGGDVVQAGANGQEVGRRPLFPRPHAESAVRRQASTFW